MNTQESISNNLNVFRRCELAKYPTPLQRFDRLEKSIPNIKLWVKRDDLIEYIVADALKHRAKTLITGAGVQSNHVRATAAVAAYLNLECIAIYWGDPPENINGNHYLTKMLGAEIRFTNNYDRSSVDTMLHFVEQEVKYGGGLPYPIPRGGACALGVIAHMFAAQELFEQCKRKSVKADLIALAVGSGGTIAGWVLAKLLYKHPWRIEGFTVSRLSSELKEIVQNLVQEAAVLLNAPVNISLDQIIIHDGCIGDGYGIPSSKGNKAIKETAMQQGVFFDPVYTGKAFAGFQEYVKKDYYKDINSVVFLHTGGEPALFL